jgi:hypothetical protein
LHEIPYQALASALSWANKAENRDAVKRQKEKLNDFSGEFDLPDGPNGRHDYFFKHFARDYDNGLAHVSSTAVLAAGNWAR